MDENKPFDLLFEMRTEMVLMQNDFCHPADFKAYKYGIQSGLALATVPLQIGWRRDDGLLDILADFSISVPEVLDAANRLMPKDNLFKVEMFYGFPYRRTASYKWYAKGIRTAFTYAMDLRDALVKACKTDDPRVTRITLEHLDFINTAMPTYHF